MSAICVLTPLVITSWPAITAAVLGAAASMGFSVVGPELHEDRTKRRRKVETEIENSEVIADGIEPGKSIVVQKGNMTIEFGQDHRGRCTVCVTSDKHSDEELKKIGQEVAGRVVQQFAYNKLVTELKARNYSVVDEEVLADDSVRLRIRL